MKQFIFWFFALYIPFGIQETPYNNVRVKTVKCFDANPKIVKSMYCHVKPTRDQKGNMTFMVSIPSLNDIWIQANIYYKLRVFQRFPFSVDFDYCKALKYPENFPVPLVGKLIMTTIKADMPGLVHQCPYSGNISYIGVNAEKLLTTVLPQIVPTGLYKLVIRFHSSKNETYIIGEGTAEIDAVDTMKRFDMG